MYWCNNYYFIFLYNCNFFYLYWCDSLGNTWNILSAKYMIYHLWGNTGHYVYNFFTFTIGSNARYLYVNIQDCIFKCNDNRLFYGYRRRRSGGVKEDAEESGQSSPKLRRTSVLQAIQNSNNHVLLLLKSDELHFTLIRTHYKSLYLLFVYPHSTMVLVTEIYITNNLKYSTP